MLDHQRVDELARINGDLGRLGELLKLWLQDDARTAVLDEATLRAALAKIDATQNRMIAVMQLVVFPQKKS